MSENEGNTTGLVADQFGVVFDAVPGLDGTTWARMQIVYGISAFTLALPVEKFEQMISHMGKEGMMLVNEIKRPKSNLSVASHIPDNLRDANPAKLGLNGKRRR